MDTIGFIFIWGGLAVLLIWVLLMGIGSAVAGSGKKKDKKPPKADHPPPKPAASHDSHKGHGSHGHDDHGHGKKAGPLTWAVSILLLVVGLALVGTWLIDWDAGNRDRMVARRFLYFAPASAVPSSMPAPAPPDSIDCKGEGLAAALVEPDEPVVVRTVPGTRFWFTPGTDEGTITLCDYFNPSICSSATERRTIPTSAFLVGNDSDGPVAFYCEHRPL